MTTVGELEGGTIKVIRCKNRSDLHRAIPQGICVISMNMDRANDDAEYAIDNDEVQGLGEELEKTEHSGEGSCQGHEPSAEPSCSEPTPSQESGGSEELEGTAEHICELGQEDSEHESLGFGQGTSQQPSDIRSLLDRKDCDMNQLLQVIKEVLTREIRAELRQEQEVWLERVFGEMKKNGGQVETVGGYEEPIGGHCAVNMEGQLQNGSVIEGRILNPKRISNCENVDGVSETEVDNKEDQSDDTQEDVIASDAGSSDDVDKGSSRTGNKHQKHKNWDVNEDDKLEPHIYYTPGFFSTASKTEQIGARGDPEENGNIADLPNHPHQASMSDKGTYILLQEIENMMHNLRKDIKSEIKTKISSNQKADKDPGYNYLYPRLEPERAESLLHNYINITTEPTPEPTAPPIQEPCKATSDHDAAPPRRKRFPMKPFVGYILYPLIIVTILFVVGLVAYLMTRPKSATPNPVDQYLSDQDKRPSGTGFIPPWPTVESGILHRKQSGILHTPATQPPAMNHKIGVGPHPILREFREHDETTSVSLNLPARPVIKIPMHSPKPTTARALFYTTLSPLQITGPPATTIQHKKKSPRVPLVEEFDSEYKPHDYFT